MFESKFNRFKIFHFVIVMTFIALIGKLAYIGIYEKKDLNVITENQYSVEEKTIDLNFKLLDSNYKDILKYIDKYYCTIDLDSFKLNNRDTSIENIKTLIYILKNYDKTYDLNNLENLHQSQKLYYEIDESTYNKLKDNIKDIKGIYCFHKKEVDRTFPWKYENMITTFTDTDNKEKEKDSIEMYIKDKTKSNDFEGEIFQKSLDGQYVNGSNYIPEKNTNVVLTTDSDIERQIKNLLLKDEYKKYKQIGVILGDPSNGDILSLVQRDDWKPNINLCSATENGYEPGSIFKTIVFETALEEGKIPLNYNLTCNGENCYSVHGTLDLEDAYILSCNAYFGQMGEILRFDNILNTSKKQGLFSKVLNFSGNEEAVGDYFYAKKPNGIVDGSERILAFGQSMRFSPIQALSMINTVVNDGRYIKPHLIKSFVNSKNEVLENEEVSEEKVIKSSTANVIKNDMIKIIKNIQPDSPIQNIYEMGGKTGTNTRMQDGIEHSDGWFTGYTKINNNYYTMVVFVEDIDTKNEWGSDTAVPIFLDVINTINNNLK